MNYNIKTISLNEIKIDFEDILDEKYIIWAADMIHITRTINSINDLPIEICRAMVVGITDTDSIELVFYVPSTKHKAEVEEITEKIYKISSNYKIIVVEP